MILEALINIATTISISAFNPTTLVFSDPIQFVSIGKSGDFSFYTNNNKKVIVIQPLKDLKTTEMIVLTEDRNYQFKIHIETLKAQNYYQIINGKPNSSFTQVLKTENYEVLEGASSLMVKNLSSNDQLINDETLKAKAFTYLPKGGAIYLNNQRIY